MNNIDELMTKLGNDKYKNVSPNLEFLTECGVEFLIVSIVAAV